MSTVRVCRNWLPGSSLHPAPVKIESTELAGRPPRGSPQWCPATGDRNRHPETDQRDPDQPLPYRERTTITGTFADCATAALTEPSVMPANPPRP